MRDYHGMKRFFLDGEEAVDTSRHQFCNSPLRTQVHVHGIAGRKRPLPHNPTSYMISPWQQTWPYLRYP